MNVSGVGLGVGVGAGVVGLARRGRQGLAYIRIRKQRRTTRVGRLRAPHLTRGLNLLTQAGHNLLLGNRPGSRRK